MLVLKRMLSAVTLIVAFVLGSVPSAKADITLVATNDTWLYHNDGTLPGASWYTSAFSDSAWSNGAAPLGYGDASFTYSPAPLSYGGDAANKWTSYYFRKHFTVSSPGSVTGLVATFRVDDGGAYYLNGTRIHMTANMRDPVGNNTFALLNGEAENQPFQQFTISPSMLVAGDNVLAVEVHQANLGSSDVDMELGLTAVSYATTNEIGGYPVNWTALHDCAWSDVDMMTNASLVFTTNSPVALGTNTLLTTGGQSLYSNQLIFAGSGLIGLGISPAAADIPPATDASTEFSGKIGTSNRVGWTEGTLTMTLTGLDSNKQYKTVLWVTRGASGGASVPPYTNRLTDVTLSGADSFLNTSSTGLNTTIYQSTVANDSTRIQADLAYGYVVRFEQVRPGLDGTIMFSLMPDGAMGASNAYINAIKIVESSVSSGPYVDTDLDGMDDNWEISYYGSLSYTANGDYDNDGSSNYDEYHAGTNPTSAASKLEFTSAVTNAPGTVIFSWSGVVGKTYTVQGATTVTSSWTVLQSGIAGVSPTTTYTGSTTSGRRNFMRVKVE